jgi:hypothetical protein
VPIDQSRERTYEDFSITEPADRQRHFGQWDHVRVYGPDFKHRCQEAGFKVELFGVDGGKCARYGLILGEDLFVCFKP